VSCEQPFLDGEVIDAKVEKPERSTQTEQEELNPGSAQRQFKTDSYQIFDGFSESSRIQPMEPDTLEWRYRHDSLSPQLCFKTFS
jgi:hypothetical protein